MTRVKDNPMDESANPTPRATKYDPDRKKKAKASAEETKNAKGKTDATAFDARNNNMHRKR